MTSKTMQSISTKGMLSDGFADALFGRMAKELPEGGTISAIIVASNGDREVRAHFEPLTDAEFSTQEGWWDRADLQADVYSVHPDDLVEAAKRRWPEARVFVVPSCLCCNGITDPREDKCER